MQIEPSDLTFALELFGKNKNSSMVRRILLKYLKHSSAIVREGAIYGLQRHVNSEVISVLNKLIHSDTSDGVRLAAMDVLSDAFEED